MLITLRPYCDKEVDKESIKLLPDSLPSLPMQISETFSLSHFIHIAFAICSITLSLICFGYMPLMSYSLKIDFVISIFFFFYMYDFAIIPMLNYILKCVCRY